MACLMNVLAISVVIGSFVKDAAAQGAEVKSVDNAEQFALLCRIYNVAKNPPIHHVDLQDPNKIVKEIDAINSSFAETELLNGTEQMGNNSEAQVKPTTTREAAIAQAILSHITQKAHTILKEIRKVNATRDIENVKAEFAKVILGEMMNESHLCEGALKDVTDRAEACGNTGKSSKGLSAGKNLVVDFFCLCAMTSKDKDGIDNVCGVYVGGTKGGKKPDNHGWDTKGPLGTSSMWASVKKGCGNLLHQHLGSMKEGQEVLRDFLMHLKLGGLYRWGSKNSILGSGRKAGMLGTGTGTENGENEKRIVCSGGRGYTGSRETNEPPGGVCVYYGPSPEWENIDWLKQFRTALNSAGTLNNQTDTIQRDIEKLQMLLHRAEQIYETTKVISVIQNPVLPTNLQTAAKRLTAYNAAWRHNPHAHFILLFVLL